MICQSARCSDRDCNDISSRLILRNPMPLLTGDFIGIVPLGDYLLAIHSDISGIGVWDSSGTLRARLSGVANGAGSARFEWIGKVNRQAVAFDSRRGQLAFFRRGHGGTVNLLNTRSIGQDWRPVCATANAIVLFAPVGGGTVSITNTSGAVITTFPISPASQRGRALELQARALPPHVSCVGDPLRIAVLFDSQGTLVVLDSLGHVRSNARRPNFIAPVIDRERGAIGYRSVPGGYDQTVAAVAVPGSGLLIQTIHTSQSAGNGAIAHALQTQITDLHTGRAVMQTNRLPRVIGADSNRVFVQTIDGGAAAIPLSSVRKQP